MVSFMPWPLYHQGKNPGTHWVGSCVGLRRGLNIVAEKINFLYSFIDCQYLVYDGLLGDDSVLSLFTKNNSRLLYIVASHNQTSMPTNNLTNFSFSVLTMMLQSVATEWSVLILQCVECLEENGSFFTCA
jgi:hypothetical protein